MVKYSSAVRRAALKVPIHASLLLLRHTARGIECTQWRGIRLMVL